MHESCAMGVKGMLWTQLLGVGIVWVTLHCSGMCGPLMTGFLVHCDRPDRAKDDLRSRMTRRVQGALAYQSSRAVMYAIFGALAGWIGASFEAWFDTFANAAMLITALAMMGAAIAKFVGREGTSFTKQWIGFGRILARGMRALEGIAPQRGNRRMALFGALMSFLPCALVFWVMGLAIASKSALQGALMMMTLVGLTTPMMLAVATSTSWIRGTKGLVRYLVPGALAFSSIWMLCIVAANNGLIEHAHWMFSIGAERYMFMLW